VFITKEIRKETKQRLFGAFMGLVAVGVCGLISSSDITWAQGTEEVVFIPPVEQKLVHASLVNEGKEALTVRLGYQDDTEPVIPEQLIGPEETIFFALLADQCALTPMIWVNGEELPVLFDGTLCPENHPGEPAQNMTIYLVTVEGKITAELAGEDHD
jgi:hypothetical protein